MAQWDSERAKMICAPRIYDDAYLADLQRIAATELQGPRCTREIWWRISPGVYQVQPCNAPVLDWATHRKWHTGQEAPQNARQRNI